MATAETPEESKNTPIFRDLQADDPEPETTVIESLCMNCGDNVSLSPFRQSIQK